MPRLFAIWFALLAGSSTAVQAQNDEAYEATDPHMAVLATVRSLEAGLREMRRAASLLELSMDFFADDVAVARSQLGPVITLLRRDGGRFWVVGYLGSKAEAFAWADAAREYYPTARAVSVPMPADANDNWFDNQTQRLGVVIAGSYRSYASALRAARNTALKSGGTYSDRGMVYDDKRGLIWPDDDADERGWAGYYAARRDDADCENGAPSPCVTVERSGVYGFAPNLYIVVAGIVSRSERKQRLTEIWKFAPSAYIKETDIFMGCSG